MGTVVYQQGFQSSQLNELRALRLRLSSPNSTFSQPFGLPLKSHFLDSYSEEDKPIASSGTDSSSWSFLQSLSSGSSSSLAKTSFEKEKTYVPRQSSKTLSDESLALCTESLGSESGSDVTDVEDLFSLDVQTKKLEETTTKTLTLKRRKTNVSPRDLPPPLTSMRGSQCIQMRQHREDGRLVMTATKAPPRNRCFQVERSNGCLRLYILKDSDEVVESGEETEEYKQEEEDGEEDVIDMENVNRGLLNWEPFFTAAS